MVVNLVDKKYKLVYRLEVALKEAGKEIDMRGLIDTSDVVMDIKTGRVNLNSRILFESDGVTLSQEGKDFLDVFFSVYASCILSEENSGMVSGIEIEGHTDTGGKYDYNLKLSQERADAVTNYCLTESNSGLSPEQLTDFRAMTTTVGRSADDPIYSGDDSNRVVFRFKLSTDA